MLQPILDYIFLLEVNFRLQPILDYILFNIFLLEVNFDKSAIRLHLFLIPFMLAKFLKN